MYYLNSVCVSAVGFLYQMRFSNLFIWCVFKINQNDSEIEEADTDQMCMCVCDFVKNEQIVHRGGQSLSHYIIITT